MRKIFSSPRLENVEAVARLLEAEGIEVRIENGRALHRAIRGNFSYRDDGKHTAPQPEVWVVRSDDQPRARALMREAGLLQDTTRTEGQRFAPRGQAPERGNTRRISRLRYGLIVLALVVVVVNFIRRPDVDDAPVAALISPRTALTMLDDTQIQDERVYVVATPPQLAVMLARRALERVPADVLCLAIDGHSPPEAALNALIADNIKAHADPACATESALHLDIHHYATDGSGTGTIQMTQRQGTQPPSIQTLRVRRTGEAWAVLAGEGR